LFVCQWERTKFAEFRLGADELADIALERKTPFALLVAFGGVGDTDARGGGEPEPHDLRIMVSYASFKSCLPWTELKVKYAFAVTVFAVGILTVTEVEVDERKPVVATDVYQADLNTAACVRRAIAGNHAFP